jgi:hypothetical protein
MHVFDSEFNEKKRDFNMNPSCTLDFMVLQITDNAQSICMPGCMNVAVNQKTRISI